MVFKRLLSLFLILTTLISLLTVSSIGIGENGDGEDEVDAEAMLIYSEETGFPIINRQTIASVTAVLFSPDSGMVLYSQEIDKVIHPLSLAKILTCLVALENGNLDDEITINKHVYFDIPSDYETKLNVGEVYTLRDLLYLIMLPSENDACNAVGEYIAGSTDAFVELLNQRAAEIGCTNSHFANCHGLPNENEYTTGRDLMMICQEAFKNETFMEISTATRYTIPANEYREQRKIYTTNYMISQDLSNRYYYYRAKGYKYGGITAAYGCSLIVGGNNGNIDLVAIVVGSSSYEITKGDYMLQCFPQAKILLDYGFDYFVYQTVLNKDVSIGSLKVNGGTEETAIVKPLSEAGVAVPKGFHLSDITIRLNGEITAPAMVGDDVGTATVYYKDIPISTVSVTPMRDVVLADDDHPTQTEIIIRRQEEEEKPKTPKTSLIVAVLVAVFIAFYLLAYVYNNIQRRKKKAKSVKRSSRTEQQRSDR